MAIQFTIGRFKPIALSVAVASALVSQSVIAQELTFSLPEQGLASSIEQISRQGQVALLYDKGQLNGLRAPAL
ncbi:hypothetical protein PROVRUST_07884 [Providencia rustigianii DSM 4541]|uniref:Uncharacterized protein n=2 Tax=Providencia rustigianii TaxID=158850 RepID=D1P6G2_9GAMM|nr:hypothetical protein PROVRUST_07884 [Providencia rustigianii DSM 4541]SUC25731.1 Ferric-pseudobactin 358 receptor precursor [Providencia rustigianii]